MMIKKQTMALWLPYAALSGWLMCFMRLCFLSAEQTGLGGRENILFIALCAGVVLGMFVPLPDIRTRGRKAQAWFRFAAIAAVPCTVCAVSVQSMAALAMTLLASFFASAAMGCCLYNISARLEPENFGMFFGSAFAASEGLLFIQLLLPFEVPGIAPTTVAGLCFLLLLAAGAGISAGTGTPTKGGVSASGGAQDSAAQTISATLPGLPMEAKAAEATAPDPIAPAKYIAALLLYCALGGMLDNLTAFDDAFLRIPYLLKFVYLFSAAANLALGKFFHRLDWRKLAMAGLLLICIGQALPYFSAIAVLAIPYLALTTTGVIILEFLVRGLPVRFAGGAKRQAWYAKAGYASLYGGFLLTSICFEFFPRGRYFFVMGLALILAFAILSLLQSAYGDEENEKQARLVRRLRELSETAAGAPEQPDLMHDLFTTEEVEVALLLIEGDTRRDIARKLRRTAADVNQRITAIRDKISGIGDPEPTITAAVREYKLTTREAQTLRYLRFGKTNAQIADDLVLSEATVKNHVHNMMKKLPINDRHEIPAWLEQDKSI